jgi:hypothetical protein
MLNNVCNFITEPLNLTTKKLLLRSNTIKKITRIKTTTSRQPNQLTNLNSPKDQTVRKNNAFVITSNIKKPIQSFNIMK